ncbi:MAG: diaminopimelate epimerase [Candidatus Dadabacteria bacterium]|nr:diaminopimelate epimerase [Candidatus Dadabacteria bacterium]NIV41014.1 diaminopimelate epimerase [Candidatus Dadabacteria bacterium]NIX15921.1 diaminopimelate epimerase [Candidatus Dadabacteria bacterium]
MENFVKSHGLGNDYIIVDPEQISFEFTKEVIQLICNRNYGVGSDGILLLTPSDKADFGLRILNPDGSEAEKSGNGIRIFSKFLYDYGYTTNSSFTIDTLGGLVRSDLEINEGNVSLITVDMGKASFDSSRIPVTGEQREVVKEEIRVDSDILEFTAVTVGNPHCVVFFDELSEDLIKKLGPMLENHEIFPNRINVQFAKVISPTEVQALIWERGAGYTLASGSSSCAVASACVKNNLTDSKVSVIMPGGILNIEVNNDWTLRMKGPAEQVFEGTFNNELIQRITSSNFPKI